MSLLTFCWVLFYVNALTIGGGYAMLPLLHNEFVDRHHYLTHQEFIDAIAVGQLSPGPLTVMNAFIGFKLHGLSGSLLAIVCSYLPSFIIVTFVVKYFFRNRHSDIVASGFSGIKSAVIGLLCSVALSLGAVSVTDPVTITIALLSFCVMSFTRIDPSLVILSSGILGAILL